MYSDLQKDFLVSELTDLDEHDRGEWDPRGTELDRDHQTYLLWACLTSHAENGHVSPELLESLWKEIGGKVEWPINSLYGWYSELIDKEPMDLYDEHSDIEGTIIKNRKLPKAPHSEIQLSLYRLAMRAQDKGFQAAIEHGHISLEEI